MKCAQEQWEIWLYNVFWKTFIQTKVKFLTFEKAKWKNYGENLGKNKNSDLYLQMEEWDNEGKDIAKDISEEIHEIDTDKISTSSWNKQRVEFSTSLPATATNKVWDMHMSEEGYNTSYEMKKREHAHGVHLYT